MQIITTAKPRKSRRTHQKSRRGCTNCKKRRIKCDEAKPACSNCVNHEIECEFPVLDWGRIDAPVASNSGSSVRSSSRETYQFRHYEFLSTGERQQFTLSKGDKARKPSAVSVGTQCDLLSSQGPEAISFADLELFHHFNVATHWTISDNPENFHTWQIHIVQWGLDFPSILHLILALSALHLSHERPALREKYVQQADSHFTFGVRSVTSLLSQLNSENCEKIYISAVLICFVYFGRGPRPGEYLVFSESGPAEWLVLMHGVRLLVENHRDQIFNGILKPKGQPQELSISPSLRLEIHDHIVHIKAVEQLVNEEFSDNSRRAMYMFAITALLSTLNEVYTKRSAQIPAVGLTQVLMGWLYRLPKELINLLEQKDPVSLVILSYWAMLLSYMRSVWFMRGWDEHVLAGIRASLPETFHQWIEWPTQQVQQYEE